MAFDPLTNYTKLVWSMLKSGGYSKGSNPVHVPFVILEKIMPKPSKKRFNIEK